MSEQLPLPVQLPDGETFENFVSVSNRQLVSHLKNLVGGEPPLQYSFLTFISGESGTGKSHLLYSLCHQAQSNNIRHIYLCLKQKSQITEHILDGLESMQLVCIDDVDHLLGDKQWQYGLFDLINRVKENQGCQLVLTANSGPGHINLDLADLNSRLSWGVSYHLKPLDDTEMADALIIRAQHRGIKLPEEVAHFLINHTQRDMPHLMQVLEILDQHSLRQKRKITVPFVKTTLSL